MELFLGAFTEEWERRRAAILHERSIGKRSLDEEERRRRGGGGAGGGQPKSRGAGLKGWGRANGKRNGTGKAGRSERAMHKRFRSLAQGSQPAVVKMASFGGGSRLGAMAAYVSRDGEVPLENELGQQLRGRDQVSSLKDGWEDLMSGRAESRDIGLFRVDIGSGIGLDMPKAREILTAAFGDRSFVFALSEAKDSASRIDGVVVLRNGEGERLTADAKATGIVQARINASLQAADGEIGFRFLGHGNGVEYGASRVRRLVETRPGAVEDERGRQIGDARQAGDLVQLEWRKQLHSRKPRDVMHLVMSARAGTDAEKFQDAARQFLASEFAGHRYVFALHDPTHDPKDQSAGGKRPHVHLHAIIAMRSDEGDRVETSIASFRCWREGLARHARENGIAMEMTDRRERAAAPAYTRNQVRPTDRAERTQHEGTTEFAQHRYEAKRRETPSIAATTSAKDYTETVREEWQKLRDDTRNQAIGNFAENQIKRIKTAVNESGARAVRQREQVDMDSHFRTKMVILQKLMEVDDMGAMTRSEFEAYEKRVETALFAAEKTVPTGERESFDNIVAAARAHVDVRRELMEQTEAPRERADDRRRDRDNVADDANERWNAAVARHGLTTVDAANEAMLKVEHYREAIDRVDAGEGGADKGALQSGLQRELARAAELGASGNRMIREIGEVDAELRLALQVAERAREQAREKSDENGNRSERDGGAGKSDRVGPDGEVRGLTQEGGGRGDASRTDPAAQHLPRLEELQRESDEAARRDRDDMDR